MVLLDDDLLEAFNFLTRKELAESVSLACRHFWKLSHTRMHEQNRHPVERMIVFGRQLRGDEGWREPCLAVGDIIKYKPFPLPISSPPANIVAIRDLVVSHFAGQQLVHFLSHTVRQFLLGCQLEIRFVESLLECGATERDELDAFLVEFQANFQELAIFSYEKDFQMAQSLMAPSIAAKVHTFHLNTSIPSNCRQFLLQWLHYEVNPNFSGRKLQFRTGDEQFLVGFLAEIRELFSKSSSKATFKVNFVFMSEHPLQQIELFEEQNLSTNEILSLRRVFYPKMFELSRRRTREGPNAIEEEALGTPSPPMSGSCARVLVNVFRPLSASPKCSMPPPLTASHQI